MRRTALLTFAALGAALGAIYALADALGTLAALPELFDPRPGTAALIAVAVAMPTLAWALVGALVGALWPRTWTTHLSRRRAAALALTLAALVAPGAWFARRERALPPLPSPPTLSATQPAPILWVVLDTLRADVAYGEDGTGSMPQLNAFAASALRFTDAEATAGWTLPSLAGMLTGVHNVTTDASAGFLVDWAPTIAEHLWHAGYDTRAVVDNSIVEARIGFGRGFASYFLRSGFRFAFALPGFRLLPRPVREVFRFGTRAADIGAARLTDVALATLAERRDRPLFLYVHYMDPHTPYYPHDLPDPADSKPFFVQPLIEDLRAGEGAPPDPAAMRWLWHRYRGETRFLDAHLGRLLAAFTARFGDHGLVVVAADHGEEMLDHGRLEHSFTVHRELVRVPLVVRLPAGVIPAEKALGEIPQPLSLIDLTPTVLDVVGAAPVRRGLLMLGRSRLPELRGAAPWEPRPLLSHHTRHGRSVFRYREGERVYLKTMYFDTARPTERELFFLGSDPREQASELAHEAELFGDLAARFEAHAGALIDLGKHQGQSSGGANDEALRALGYIQ